MKKIGIALLLLLFSSALQAQVCTPDYAMTEPGIKPHTLPDAVVGTHYNEVVEFKFPTDTTYNGVPIHFDSAWITDVANLPSGFTYACNQTDCKYVSGANGCVLLSGEPMSNQIGHYKLEITVKVKFQFGGTPVWQPYQDTLALNVTGQTGIENFMPSPLQQLIIKGIIPSATNNGFKIQLNSAITDNLSVSLYDETGRQIGTESYRAQLGNNILFFPAPGLKQGLYIFRIVQGDYSDSYRVMIRHD